MNLVVSCPGRQVSKHNMHRNESQVGISEEHIDEYYAGQQGKTRTSNNFLVAKPLMLGDINRQVGLDQQRQEIRRPENGSPDTHNQYFRAE
jgi:hypothetical protein